MKTSTINQNDVTSLISLIPSGAIFTVEFITKDNTVRKMNCRKGVTKYLVPNAKPKASGPSNIVKVFDMQKGAYRSFNADTTMTIKTEHQMFIVE